MGDRSPPEIRVQENTGGVDDRHEHSPLAGSGERSCVADVTLFDGGSCHLNRKWVGQLIVGETAGELVDRRRSLSWFVGDGLGVLD
jgi:hypothetical protein